MPENILGPIVTQLVQLYNSLDQYPTLKEHLHTTIKEFRNVELLELLQPAATTAATTAVARMQLSINAEPFVPNSIATVVAPVVAPIVAPVVAPVVVRTSNGRVANAIVRDAVRVNRNSVREPYVHEFDVEHYMQYQRYVNAEVDTRALDNIRVYYMKKTNGNKVFLWERGAVKYLVAENNKLYCIVNNVVVSGMYRDIPQEWISRDQL